MIFRVRGLGFRLRNGGKQKDRSFEFRGTGAVGKFNISMIVRPIRRSGNALLVGKLEANRIMFSKAVRR